VSRRCLVMRGGAGGARLRVRALARVPLRAWWRCRVVGPGELCHGGASGTG